jgi:hypothetical protein
VHSEHHGGTTAHCAARLLPGEGCLEAFFVVEALLLQLLFVVEALPLLALRSFPPSDNHHKVSLPFIE